MSLFMYNDQKNPKRVILIPVGRIEEGVAGGAIVPGQLVKVNSSGEIVVHATAGGYAEKAFADEDPLQARTLDDAYASDDRVSYFLAEPTAVIYGFLEDGENVASGDLLESAGNGDLRKRTTGIPVAMALDTLDLSGSDNVAHGRLRIRVI